MDFQGSIRKLADESLLRGNVISPTIDLQRMKVGGTVICTAAVDREQEVIVPSGVDTSDYLRNPVVLWEHGIDPGIVIPIAKCETPEGRLALSLNRKTEVLEGDAYFTSKVKESEQIFDLIVERIVRAASIHVMPIAGTKKTGTIEGTRVTIYPQSKMLEWSFGRIGVNPEAVRKILDKNRLAGSAISECLAKSLRPMAAQPSRSTVNVPFDWCGTQNKNFRAPQRMDQFLGNRKSRAC